MIRSRVNIPADIDWPVPLVYERVCFLSGRRKKCSRFISTPIKNKKSPRCQILTTPSSRNIFFGISSSWEKKKKRYSYFCGVLSSCKLHWGAGFKFEHRYSCVWARVCMRACACVHVHALSHLGFTREMRCDTEQTLSSLDFWPKILKKVLL